MIAGRHLLVSVHDVTPHHAARLARLMALIEPIIGAGRCALLVVPDFHGSGRSDADPAFVAQLRRWSDAGSEVFLHGYSHRDDHRHRSAVARFKAQRMTAGEGEFLGLDHAEAMLRLTAGRAMLEPLLGRPLAGFIAPAWLYSRDSLRALADQEFALAEDHWRVWQPQGHRIVARGPVLTYASRTPARLASSLLWSRIATVALSRARTVRFAVHPHDVDSPALCREITRALTVLTQSHRVGRYADLIAMTAQNATKVPLHV